MAFFGPGRVASRPELNAETLTALAWVKPSTYAFDADVGIIFNKEGAWEVGISNDAYADREPWSLVAAFSPCMRWGGSTRIGLHEWAAIAIAFDGAPRPRRQHGFLPAPC